MTNFALALRNVVDAGRLDMLCARIGDDGSHHVVQAVEVLARQERDRLLRRMRSEHYANYLRPRPAAEAMAKDLANFAASAWRRGQS